MLSPETLKADFEKASSVWGSGVISLGAILPGFIEDRAELVEAEEGVVERHYKVLITTASLAARQLVTAEGVNYTVTSAPARDGVYEYRLREVKA